MRSRVEGRGSRVGQKEWMVVGKRQQRGVEDKVHGSGEFIAIRPFDVAANFRVHTVNITRFVNLKTISNLQNEYKIFSLSIIGKYV